MSGERLDLEGLAKALRSTSGGMIADVEIMGLNNADKEDVKQLLEGLKSGEVMPNLPDKARKIAIGKVEKRLEDMENGALPDRDMMSELLDRYLDITVAYRELCDDLGQMRGRLAIGQNVFDNQVAEAHKALLDAGELGKNSTEREINMQAAISSDDELREQSEKLADMRGTIAYMESIAESMKTTMNTMRVALQTGIKEKISQRSEKMLIMLANILQEALNK
jgi:hypothetical protein